DPLGDRAEQRRRDLEIEQHPPGPAKFPRHPVIGGPGREVAIDIAQRPKHPRGCGSCRVDPVMPQRIGRVAPELIEIPAALRDPDDRYVQHASLDQADESGKRLEFGEVSSGPEDDERLGPLRWCRHFCPLVRLRPSTLLLDELTGVSVIAQVRESPSPSATPSRRPRRPPWPELSSAR